MGTRTRSGLSSPVFHILVTLAEGPAHGYAILKDVEERTEGEVRLRPGTLYRAITRLLTDGWIEEAGDSRAADDDRRTVYRLTSEGRTQARSEALRLAQMVAAARAHRLITEEDLT